MVLLNAPLDERVEHSFENYILANLHELSVNEPDEKLAFDQFSEGLLGALDRVKKRLGGDRYNALKAIMLEALQSHRLGDPSGHRDWIRTLLEQYYDPMYNYQLADRRQRLAFEGKHGEVASYLQTLGEPSGPT